MNITELLDGHETIETEEALREICRLSDIPRNDVLVRDISHTDFEYDNATELVLFTIAVMLETSDAQLVIDVVTDNQRQKRREDFVKHKVVDWSFPYKAHNKGHGSIVYREYYVKRRKVNHTIDEIVMKHLDQPLIINKDYMFVKFAHNFDHELLDTFANRSPDTRDYSKNVGRLATKHILSNNGQTVRGNTETGDIYRTEFLADPDFRDIWNQSLEHIAKVRKLPFTRNEYGDIDSVNNLLMYDFVLDFNEQTNTPFDVTYYIAHEYIDENARFTSLLYIDGHVPCAPNVLACVMYLPTSAKDSFYIVGHHQDTHRHSLWEHEIHPGEAIFLSNKVRFELLNYEQQFPIFGFNIVNVCDLIDTEVPQDFFEVNVGNPYLLNIKRQQINTIEKSRRY